MPALDPITARARTAVRQVLAGVAGRVVVGVSGGADSLALAAVVAEVEVPDEVLVRVVDHGLQAGSAEVAQHAAEQVRALGLAVEVVRVEVSEAGGLEAGARRARYAALAADDPAAVLVAHTRDDQAETVLLGLGRGSGPRSIAGMRVVDGVVRRPFLDLSRADTERLCRDRGLAWWSDPHNADSAFRRARLRHEVLPLLDDVLDGGVVAALARTADQVRADNDLLDRLAAESATDDAVALAALDPAIRVRVLRLMALTAGARAAELNATHLAELDRLVTDWRGQLRVELPGSVSCSRRAGRLAFAPTPFPSSGGISTV